MIAYRVLRFSFVEIPFDVYLEEHALQFLIPIQYVIVSVY